MLPLSQHITLFYHGSSCTEIHLQLYSDMSQNLFVKVDHVIIKNKTYYVEYARHGSENSTDI